MDLNDTLARLLHDEAPEGSHLQRASLDFSVPNANFRGAINNLTLNLYLHEIRENLEMRRADPFIQRNPEGTRAASRRAPAIIDCGYCITAWSPLPHDQDPTREEHWLLGDALAVLLRCQEIPRDCWVGHVADLMRPYATTVAQPGALKAQAEFWTALGHPPKPSLTYVVSIAMPVHDATPLQRVVGPTEQEIHLGVDVQMSAGPSTD